MEKTYVVRLSHENLSLALSEFNSILMSEEIAYDIELGIDEFAIFRAPRMAMDVLLKRAALILELGELVDIVDADKSMDHLLRVVRDSIDEENVCLALDSVKGFGKDVAKKLVEALSTVKICTRKAIDKGARALKISFLENVAIVYRLLYRRRHSMYVDREPHRRPCYRPGTMKPILARAFINLSRVSTLKNEVVFDPFCGVGGFALEACLMGLRAICGDIDEAMVRGAKANMDGYGCSSMVDVLRMDARFEALAGSRVDGVATDPPYGIQTSPKGEETLEHLIAKFVDSVRDVLKAGRFMVFATPLSMSRRIDRVLQDTGFLVVERHVDKVHGSLTRAIYVVKRL